jgi:hypothetical protein
MLTVNNPEAAPDPILADLIERLAQAESALPWQRATSPEGLDYLRANALSRLARLDPLSRGLLVGYAESVAVQHGWARPEPAAPAVTPERLETIPERIPEPPAASARRAKAPAKTARSLFADLWD